MTSAPTEAAFWQAELTLTRYVCWRREVEGVHSLVRPSRAEIETAAALLRDYVRASGDPQARIFVAARCADFFKRRLRLPRALEMFLIEEIAEPSLPQRKRGNKGAGLLEREVWKTHATHVQVLLDLGMSLDDACAEAAAFPAHVGARSAETMKRHWRWAVAHQSKATKPE